MKIKYYQWSKKLLQHRLEEVLILSTFSFVLTFCDVKIKELEYWWGFLFIQANGDMLRQYQSPSAFQRQLAFY